MRILILNKKAKGIINLKEQDHFLLDNIDNFGEVLKKIIAVGKNHFDYKFCVMEDGEFIPFFMKIKFKMMNQMEEFSFDRVKFSELDIDEKVKEKFIVDMVEKNNLIKIGDIEKQVLKLIIRKEFGENIEKKVNKFKNEYESLEKEMKNIDYKKYINDFV